MRVIYGLLGLLTLAIGIIGIILPVLPTTPFLLLTLFFFAKSSTRFHQWFIHTSLYNRCLADFVETRSMKRSDKLKLMLFVDLVLLITILVIRNWGITILLIILDLLKYYYFSAKVKTT